MEPADLVIAHRVVCRYPDHPWPARCSGRAHPRPVRVQLPSAHPVSRAVVPTQNTMFRLARREFRTFAHSPAAMLAVLADHGLRPAVAHRGPVWQVATADR